MVYGLLATTVSAARGTTASRPERLLAALKHAVAVAEEARLEWDAAPSGMRAGKLLIALTGLCPGYRADIDEIHAAIADQEPLATGAK